MWVGHRGLCDLLCPVNTCYLQVNCGNLPVVQSIAKISFKHLIQCEHVVTKARQSIVGNCLKPSGYVSAGIALFVDLVLDFNIRTNPLFFCQLKGECVAVWCRSDVPCSPVGQSLWKRVIRPSRSV